MSDADFLTAVDAALSAARAELACQVDRCEALVQLYNRAVAVQAERDYPIDLSDLRAAAESEQDRAELEAVVNRAIEKGNRS